MRQVGFVSGNSLVGAMHADAAAGFANVQQIVQRNRLIDRADFVIAVFAKVQNVQGPIDFGVGPDLNLRSGHSSLEEDLGEVDGALVVNPGSNGALRERWLQD